MAEHCTEKVNVCVRVLQVQAAGQSPGVQPPSARPGTASPSQQEEEEKQQQQQAEQQQSAEPASVDLERHLHKPVDSTPASVSAALQHLLQQSRTLRHWHPDEVCFL